MVQCPKLLTQDSIASRHHSFCLSYCQLIVLLMRCGQLICSSYCRLHWNLWLVNIYIWILTIKCLYFFSGCCKDHHVRIYKSCFLVICESVKNIQRVRNSIPGDNVQVWLNFELWNLVTTWLVVMTAYENHNTYIKRKIRPVLFVSFIKLT